MIKKIIYKLSFNRNCSTKIGLSKGLLLLVCSIFTLTTVNAYAYDSKAKYAILYDYNTSTVLYSKSPDEQMTPSSMTKLMTAYITFQHLAKGAIKLGDKFKVSEKAWRMGGSKMFVAINSEIPIDDLLKGIIVQSGNDACVVVAENLASSEENFAQLMNKTAKEIGMTHSSFKNSTGMPEPGHSMTVRDLAILASRIIRDFPQYYYYFSTKEFTYNNIRQTNRNALIFRDIGADGLKTGHTDEGGYGLVGSAKQGERRLIVVVNGLDSDKERADEAETLLNYGFRSFESKTLLNPGQTVSTAEVWMGEKTRVPLVTKDAINLVLPMVSSQKPQIEVKYQGPISAPITKGQEIATLYIKIPDQDEKIIPLYAGENIAKASLLRKFDILISYYLNMK